MEEQFIHASVRAETELHAQVLKLANDEGSALIGTQFVGWLAPDCQRESGGRADVDAAASADAAGRTMVANEGRQVALVDLARKPLGRFGEEVFRSYEALHRGVGIALHFGEQVADVVNQGSSRVLKLGDESRVPADVIVVGVGVRVVGKVGLAALLRRR